MKRYDRSVPLRGARAVQVVAWRVAYPWFFFLAGGRHLATYSGGTTTFLHTDWLGTKRAVTDTNGNVSETCYTWPFGDNRGCSGTDSSYSQYTDDIHDSESNLEHTDFRQLSTTQGRWLSPDPYLGSMDLTNPQSFNRYAYVMNGPTNSADPTGLDPCEYHSGWSGNCGHSGDPCSDPWFADGHAECPYMPGGPPIGIWIGGSSGPGGGGTPTTEPNVNPSGKPPLSGEALGIPNTVHIHIPSILQTLGLAPNDPVCDFVACGTGAGNGFQDVRTLAPAAPICVIQPEVCVVVGVAGLIYIGINYGPQIVQMAKETGTLIDAYNEYLRDLHACAQAYPPGPERDNCYKAAKAKLDFKTGKIKGPTQ